MLNVPYCWLLNSSYVKQLMYGTHKQYFNLKKSYIYDDTQMEKKNSKAGHAERYVMH
jgi:hypothetical protein